MQMIRQDFQCMATRVLIDTGALGEVLATQGRRGRQIDKRWAGQLDRAMRERMKPRCRTQGLRHAAIF